MATPTIRTIIFDFGNVLGFFDHQITWNKVAPHTDLTMEQMLAAIREHDLEERYETGKMTSDEFVDTLKTVGKLRCQPEYIREAWKDIFRPNQDLCNLLPQLRAKKYQLQLGSNTNELHAEQFLQQFEEALDPVEHFTLSHEVGHRKPKAEFFADCHTKSGHAPQECVFIDDLPANIDGARSFGLHGIVYTGVDQLKEELKRLGVGI